VGRVATLGREGGGGREQPFEPTLLLRVRTGRLPGGEDGDADAENEENEYGRFLQEIPPDPRPELYRPVAPVPLFSARRAR
jgi:hypothetical protein